MAWRDVLNILEKNPGKKYGARELQEILGVNTASMTKSLRAIRKGRLALHESVFFDGRHRRLVYWIPTSKCTISHPRSENFKDNICRRRSCEECWDWKREWEKSN